MVNWAEKRQRAGSKLVRQGIRTAADPSIGNIALTAYRGVKMLRAIVNSEEHQLDVSLYSTLSGGTAVITHLNPIAQGDTQSNRTGNSCLMTHLRCRPQYVFSPDTILREIYFIDKQQVSDTAPTAAMLLEDGTNPLSFYNKSMPGRFQILSDKTLAVNATKTGSIKLRPYTKKLQKHAIFNGTASTDIQKNGVYRLLLSDQICTSFGYARLGFHDN